LDATCCYFGSSSANYHQISLTSNWCVESFYKLSRTSTTTRAATTSAATSNDEIINFSFYQNIK
jgi:hypothetical protein